MDLSLQAKQATIIPQMVSGSNIGEHRTHFKTLEDRVFDTGEAASGGYGMACSHFRIVLSRRRLSEPDVPELVSSLAIVPAMQILSRARVWNWQA